MAKQIVSVSLYTKLKLKPVEWFEGITSEQVCVELCKKIGITQETSLLFALRIRDSNFFIPGCAAIESTVQYEFRLRFQISQLSTLKRKDHMALDYLYHQTNYDLIREQIPELVYPTEKNKVTGLCVTSMHIEMLEENASFDYLMQNYKNYVPKVYVKKHSFAIKDCIYKALKTTTNNKYNSFYKKGVYLETMKKMAPNYLAESCTAVASYPPDEEMHTGTTMVDLEFAPFHLERPGLSIYYQYSQKWKHISRIENIYAIFIADDNVVKFEMGASAVSAGFQVQIPNKIERESFVSCIAGYYRLTVKWAFNLCRELESPTLKRLKELRCYGPIDGSFAYTILQKNLRVCGSHIIRQCKKHFDQYYIDIITERDLLPKTYKVTNQDNGWLLHMFEGIERFKSLKELIKNIETDSKQKVQMKPNDHEDIPCLLLCLPPRQMTTKKALSADSESEMRNRGAQALSHGDFRKFIKTTKVTNNGFTTEIKAEWMLPDDMKLEVTLKTLINTECLSEFIGVAQIWGSLNSPELIKMYGYSLTAPATYVIESMKLGPFDEFLRAHDNKISVGCMIDAAHSLARALHYLQEQSIPHGHIRCSSLKVIRYEAPNLITVRLGDPFSFSKNKTDDLPWIPVAKSQNSNYKSDLTDDVYANATTLWEIFSHGSFPIVNKTKSRHLFPRPLDCPADIYRIMLEGWNPEPDQRISPQMIIVRLVRAKEASLTKRTSRSSICSNHSECSEGSNGSRDENLEDLDLENGDEEIYIQSNNGGMPKEKGNIAYDLPNGGIIVFQEKLGAGQYGTVFRGLYELNDTDDVMEVAIKTFNDSDKSNQKDFEREINIMKNLDHKNVVKVITYMNEPLSIVMELVKHKSFLDYLKFTAPSLHNLKLLKFAKDIATGMEYLVCKNIVHRDLAARNVLVDINECVKICDFGLAQKMGSKGYYRKQTDRYFPIEWYAPESLEDYVYSPMSDVWSFGVTLFEMFSRGMPPKLINHAYIGKLQLQCLENGQRLHKPRQCTDDIYGLMMSCWNISPEMRPTFTELITKIDKLINVHLHNRQTTQSVSGHYVSC